MKHQSACTKYYVDGPTGQLHVRSWGEASANTTPVICLPPAPFSSIAFSLLAPLLAVDRQVLAIDYPGYGESDPIDSDGDTTPAIRDFARAALAVKAQLLPQQPVDMLGFHTGCLVAAESALTESAAVRQLVLIDAPCFDESRRQQLLESTPARHEIGTALSTLEKDWQTWVTKRLAEVGIERALALFVDQLRPGSHRNAAFRAAFRYDWRAQLDKIEHPALVIATKAGLYDETLRAAATLTRSTLVELPDIVMAVLETGGPAIRDALRQHAQ